MTNKKIKLQYDENTHIIEIASKTNCIEKIKNNFSVSLIVSMLSFIISILAFLVSYNQNVLYKDELMVNLPVFNLSDEIETEEACKYDIDENKCLIHKIKNTGGEIYDSYVEVNYYWDFIFKHNDKKFVYRLEILDCFNKIGCFKQTITITCVKPSKSTTKQLYLQCALLEIQFVQIGDFILSSRRWF